MYECQQAGIARGHLGNWLPHTVEVKENGECKKDVGIFFFFFFFGCAWDFFSCSERGLFFVAVRRLLIAVASLAAEHGL